jgi:23S rRNA pseudouridine2605 synthase
MAEDRPQHRIAKLLARAGVASRREVERMIVEGRVARDGVVIDTPATVLASLHGVTVDGNPVAAPAPARLFLFHKPAGVLTTERDPGGRPTIYDRLPRDLPRLVPVGRLDLNTEGLLLMTTDGALKRQLELPSTGVERAYRARAYGPVTQEQLEDLIEGVEIEGVRYGSIDANLERRTGANVWIEMVLTEGKNREVRRVLEYLGLKVGRLIRTRYGPFVLGDLPVGDIGEVRAADLAAFRQMLAKSGREASRGAPVAVAPAPPGPAPKRAPRTRTAPGAEASPRRPGAARAPASAGASPKRSPAVPAERPASTSAGAKRHAAASLERSARPIASKRPAPEVSAETTDLPSRPARVKRKAGWAAPKPRTGPKRPRKK